MVTRCTEHKRTRAAWTCRGCERALCEHCVAEKAIPGAISGQSANVCVHCSGFAERMMVPKRIVPYWEKIGDFVKAMTSLEGVTQLIGLGLVCYLMGLVPWVGGLISTFILISYYFQVIASAAAGGERLPEPADFLGPSTMLAPVVRFFVASAMIWLPVTIYVLVVKDIGALAQDPRPLLRDPFVFVLLIAGVLYTPASIITAAISQSIVAVFNPMITIRMIMRIPTQYLGMVGLWIGLNVLDGAARLALNKMEAVLYIPVLTAVVVQILKLPISILTAMIMGRLIYQNGHHFGVVRKDDEMEPSVPNAKPKGTLKEEVKEKQAPQAIELGPEEPMISAPAPIPVDDLALDLGLNPTPADSLDDLELELPDDDGEIALPKASSIEERPDLPNNDALAARLTALLSKSGHEADALDLFMREVQGRSYPKLDPKSELKLCSLLERARYYEEASRAAQRAAKIDMTGPLAPRAVFTVARLLEERLSQQARALAMYRYLVQQFPTDALAANAEAKIKALERGGHSKS